MCVLFFTLPWAYNKDDDDDDCKALWVTIMVYTTIIYNGISVTVAANCIAPNWSVSPKIFSPVKNPPFQQCSLSSYYCWPLVEISYQCVIIEVYFETPALSLYYAIGQLLAQMSVAGDGFVTRHNSCVHTARSSVPEWLRDIALFTQWAQPSSHQWLYNETDETRSVAARPHHTVSIIMVAISPVICFGTAGCNSRHLAFSTMPLLFFGLNYSQ